MKGFFKSVCVVSMVVLMVFALGGCNIRDLFTGPPPPPTEDLPPVTQTEADRVESECVVVPARSVVLRAASAGTITEISAVEGEQVDRDAVLVRFDATDAELAIRQAEAGLSAAQARLALVDAGTRPEEVAKLEGQLAAAEAALAQAIAESELQALDTSTADLLDAQTSLYAAQVALNRANEEHDATMTCYDVTLPDGTQERACPMLGTFEEQARFQMQAAQAALAAEQAQYYALQTTAQARVPVGQAAVGAESARSAAVQAEVALITAGPRAEERAVAEAIVQQAEAALERATARLTQSTVQAPFAATITELPIHAGDSVAAGDALMTLATMDHLQVQTKDLTELDVVKVGAGQAAVITLDAMPGIPLQGHVERIDPQSADYLGDVVYTVVIAFDEAPPPWLRWGMSGLVEILEEGAVAADVSGTKADSALVQTGTAVAEAAAGPERLSAARFVVGGTVDTVQVTTGDLVAAGDVLAYLDRTDAMLAVHEATTALARAEAELGLKQAGPRPEAITAAEAELQAARSDLNKAVAMRNQLHAGGAEAERAVVEAQLQAAWAERQRALLEVDWARESGDQDRITAAQEQLSVAEMKIEAAETRLEILPVVAAAEIRAADAGVASAQAQVEIAQAGLALAQAGPIEAEVALARAEVEIAQANLAAAQVTLDRHTLYAPFTGTVTEVAVEVGDPVHPGEAVLGLIDIGPLQLTTVDLNELDVVRVAEGQSVEVKVDALPDRVLRGHIARIKYQGVDYRGDVTYPLVVDLDEPLPELRWGMRAVVTVLPGSAGGGGGVAVQP